MTSEKERAIGVEVYRGVIPDDDAKVLLVRRSEVCSHNPGKWEFPGGKKKDKETPVNALIRETGKEVGLEVEPVSGIIHVETRTMEGGNYDGFLHVANFILMRVVRGTVRLSLEHDKYTWASHGRVPDYNLTDDSRGAFVAFEPILSEMGPGYVD